jgi:hypothetical protein
MYKHQTHTWSITRLVFFIAGALLVTATALTYFVSEWFLLFLGMIGAMQMFYALTGYCPMAMLLKKLGAPHETVYVKKEHR